MVVPAFSPPQNYNYRGNVELQFLNKLLLTEYKMNRKTCNNFTKEEWETVEELREDKSIFIKEKDNGGSCIVIDATYYTYKMMEELNDTSTYREVDENIDKKMKQNIVKSTKRSENFLTNKKIKYPN